MQKTDEPLCQIKKNTPAETDIQILFQSENKGFSVLGSNAGSTGTEIALQYKTLFFVLRGTLIISDMETHAWKLQKGDYILLPKRETIRLHIAPDTRYIELKTDKLVSPERELCEYQVHNYDNYAPPRNGEIINRTILAGPHSILMTMLFSGEAGPAQYALPGKAILFVMEGRGEVFYKKQLHQVFEGQKRSFANGGHFMVKAKGDLKAVLLVSLV